MNAVLYARVSTDKQAEKELSIPAQLQAMRDYSGQHGWTVLEEFVEPGASAKTAERPVLKQLLARCKRTESPRPEIVLVHKIDRLARNVYDHATIKALLKQLGIRLASVAENMDDTVSGELVENIMASIAQFYSANLADEVRKGMRQKVLKGGWPHKPPRGYVVVRDPDSTSSHVELHPNESPLIRAAFELYVTGWYSVEAITLRLAQQGVVSSSGGPISQTYMLNLLKNPFYAGRVRWGELNVSGNHTALISFELFEKVQGVIKAKYRHPGIKGSISGFPLRGVAICGTCRGHMTAERHDGRWGYYRCGRNAYRKELCRAKFCNADRAHQGVERICKQVRLSRAVAEEIRDAGLRLIDERIATTRERRAALDAQQAELLEQEMKLTELFTAGDLSGDAYKSKGTNLRARRAKVLDELSASHVTREQLIAAVDEMLRLATSLWDLYQQLSDAKRSDLLRSVFAAIVLGPEGVVGFTLRPPFDRVAPTSKRSAESMNAHDLAEHFLNAA